MNEEVQVSMGLNTTAFSEGLKKATRDVSSIGSKLKSVRLAVETIKAS